MEAYVVTDEVLKHLKGNSYAFIAVNYANGDMVGHTGDFDAAKKAIEVVDECVGTLVNHLLELNAHVLITAEHGNSEQVVDDETGMTKTSHTLNPVMSRKPALYAFSIPSSTAISAGRKSLRFIYFGNFLYIFVYIFEYF